MAIPQTPDLGLLEHFGQVKEFVLLIASMLIGLIVWAWTRMEKSVDKCASAIETHAANNEVLFDKVFDQIRKSDEKLNKLLGEHKSCKDDIDHIKEHCNQHGGGSL